MRRVLNRFLIIRFYQSIRKILVFLKLKSKLLIKFSVLFLFMLYPNFVFCCSLNEYNNLYYGCKEEFNNVNYESECSGNYDCPEACNFFLGGAERAVEFNITDCIIGIHPNCKVMGYSDEYGFIARIEAEEKDHFYPVQISCSNIGEYKDFRLFYFYTSGSKITYSVKNEEITGVSHTSLKEGMYRNMPNDDYKNYKNKSYNLYPSINRNFKATYDNYDMLNIYKNSRIDHFSYGWCKSPGLQRASRVHRGIVKYLNNGFIVAPVRIICSNEGLKSFVYTIRELKGSYGSRELYCTKGYKPNSDDTDCIAKTTTITLYKQGGTGGTDSVTATFGSPMPSITLPTKTGYNFTGYRYTSDPTSDLYYSSNGSSCKNWDGDYELTHLVAHWEEKTVNCKPGYYLPANKFNNDDCLTCPQNNYCTGGTYKYNKNIDQGITKCQQREFSDSGAKSIEDCYIICPSGFFCKDDRYYKHKQNTGIYLCNKGYYLDKDENKDGKNKKSIDTNGIHIRSEEETKILCYPCDGLYDSEYQTYNKDVNEINFSHFSSKFCERSSTKGFEVMPKECTPVNDDHFTTNQNNSYNETSKSRQSCYIQLWTTVKKKFIDSEETLEIIENCFYQ